MKALAAFFLIFVSLSIASAEPFVVIVRHGEKASNSDKDPDLSSAGTARAMVLAEMLKDSGVIAIFTTEFKRTQETAAPASKSLGVTAVSIPAKDIATLAGKLRELKGNALVVGHGNTIPDLVKSLGIDAPVNISENDYSQILVINLGDKPQLLRLRFPGDITRFNNDNVKAESSPSR
jgi:phosphohistidine phosphatase SixA